MYWLANNNQGPCQSWEQSEKINLHNRIPFYGNRGGWMMLYYKGEEEITKDAALLVKPYLGSRGICPMQTSFGKEKFTGLYYWPMEKGALHEDLKDNCHQWRVVVKTLSLHFSTWIFFFFNTKQCYSLVLSSKNLEKSSYYLSMRDGYDQKVKLKNKCCVTVADTIDCFLNSHSLLSSFTSNPNFVQIYTFLCTTLSLVSSDSKLRSQVVNHNW